MKRVLLAGAGHAHALLLASLAKKPLAGAQVTVVSPERVQLYSGMVPGYLSGHYRLDEIGIDFARLCARCGADFVQGSLAALDAERRCATLANGNVLAYDIASLDVGSRTDDRLSGSEHAVTVKPLPGFIERVLAIDKARVAVIGGGAAGAELSMALAARGLGVVLHADRAIEPPVREALRNAGVDTREVAVLSIGPGPAIDTKGTTERFDFAVLATGPAPHPWQRSAGVQTDGSGFFLTDALLRSVSRDDLFAVGDCATLRDAPHAKSGVFAVRQAPILEWNLRAMLGGGRLRAYRPQRRSLMLLSCGARRTALLQWGAVRARGAWAWHLKDAIDRRFIARFQ
ncbi:MAG: FAD-dependent oxidoreductase [Betaproteobacteria bacterium]|nr:FAD-dependent oxidoreductase [Betaproteobacteria bacterium]